jgi:hypothetical protein
LKSTKITFGFTNVIDAGISYIPKEKERKGSSFAIPVNIKISWIKTRYKERG